MKVAGIERAARRLFEARQHAIRLLDLEVGLDVPAFEREWSLFLSAINSVHEILKTSARSNAKCRQWMDIKDKNFIRKDPLLKYLLHARGVDFHGLESGASPDVKGADYVGYVENFPMSFAIRDEHGVVHHQGGGGAIQLAGEVTSFSFSYKLVPVTDERHGNVFDPPTFHLGLPVEDSKPTTVAKLALDYYSSLLEEAATMV